MNDALNYSLVRYQPHPGRHEVINIGVALFAREGPLLDTSTNMGKLLAIDPNFDIGQVYVQAAALKAAIENMAQQGMSAQQTVEMLGRAMAGATLMPLGSVAMRGRTPHEILSSLMADLVIPPARKRSRTPASHSRLNVELTTLFRQAQMLGKNPDDIANHKVVPHFPIDADVGLYAEFALRNGKLHITETLDFRVKERLAKKREAEAKALVLLQALETVGRDDLQRYVIIGGADSDTQSSINLLGRYADHLVVREDPRAWSSYIDRMVEAAKQQHPIQ